MRVVVLCGPTAAGKTSVSLDLAERHDAEIVNADSTQVYRGMDVGTDKLALEDRRGIPHHLIDLVDPDEEYTAAYFVRDARTAIADILERGKLPLVVGGTGFYIRSLLHGLFPQPPIDPGVREQLDGIDLPQLYARLEQEDPAAAAGIDPNDRFRISRALEVLISTGEPISVHWARHAEMQAAAKPLASARKAVERLELAAPYEVLKLGVNRPREELYAAIETRARGQIYDGPLEAEVRRLLNEYPADLKAFKALTYPHMIAVIQKQWSAEEAFRILARDTRRYAKRQLTWFRGDPEVRWFELPGELDALHNGLARWQGAV